MGLAKGRDFGCEAADGDWGDLGKLCQGLGSFIEKKDGREKYVLVMKLSMMLGMAGGCGHGLLEIGFLVGRDGI